MAQDGTPPKGKINRWIMEPLYLFPGYLALLLVMILVLITFGSISIESTNTACLAFLAMAAAFAIGFIVFIIWKSRK